ncbi:60S ribosomal protein L1 [Ophiocordyceps camponoti-floridani]|uniref:60S ribosomal protein L1 n=1 Tax=Ophiocordyceps camponoti-floridani TaxID=2030778 RepID=A0A8H4Q7H8_9HYPO|nr:60S ribosomal protein L1 [Ophiocordyceps camponoti-floridani]
MARLSLSCVARPLATRLPRYLTPTHVKAEAYGTAKIKVDKKKKGEKRSKDPREKAAEELKAAKLNEPTLFIRHKLEKYDFPQFSLCDAMRVIRAAEVGQPPTTIKYELHIMLSGHRRGPAVRGTIRLPAPAQNDWQIAVICPEGSQEAMQATAEGAVLVGEEKIFEAVRKQDFTFDRLLCHESSENSLKRANLGRILGPKGLMPSDKTGTIITDVVKIMRASAGSIAFREREGVVHSTVGQLSNTVEQLQSNIRALVKSVRLQCVKVSDNTIQKEISEVVLSSTNGPAFTLNGNVADENATITPEQVSGPM